MYFNTFAAMLKMYCNTTPRERGGLIFYVKTLQQVLQYSRTDKLSTTGKYFVSLMDMALSSSKSGTLFKFTHDFGVDNVFKIFCKSKGN